MSKLLDLIDKRIEQKMNAQDSIKYAPAEVLAVYKNEQDIIVRADVKLLANGTVIKNMLNKTSEKLTVGQGVKVAYLTLPSAGWIAVANGEADPLKSGEGGGDIWNVETAAVFNSDNFDNFVIDEEEMVEISPSAKLFYGANNRFIVIQGILCYYGAWNNSSTVSGAAVLPPTINGSAEAFQAILDNWEYFSHCLGDMDDPNDTIMTYRPNNTANNIVINYTSLAISTDSAVMQYSNNTETVCQTIRAYASSWSLVTDTSPATLKFYSTLTEEEKASVTQTYHWGGETYSNYVYHNGNMNLPELATQYALIPIIDTVSAATTVSRCPTPYGYAQSQGFLIIADGEWTRPNYRSPLTSWRYISSNGAYTLTYIPFRSQAELDFALGLTKRSEPTEGNND